MLVVFSPVRAQDKVGTTGPAFLGIGMGARATAMGGAQTALADGPSALYWNPSAITRMPVSGVEFSTASWLVDTRIQYVGVVLNTGLGHLGFSIMALNYGDMEVTTEIDPEGTGEVFTPLDLSAGVTYAQRLTDRFAVGGTVKLVRQRIWNESAAGAAVDLGVNYHMPYRNFRIGMTMANFGTSMRMAGKDLRKAIDIDPEAGGNNPRNAANLEVDDWPMPLTFRVGLAIDVVQGENQRVSVASDFLAPYDNAQSASFGGEYAFRDALFFRGGYRQAFTHITSDGGWTAGFGLRYALNDRLSGYFDYTYQHYGDLDAPQMFSLGVTF